MSSKHKVGKKLYNTYIFFINFNEHFKHNDDTSEYIYNNIETYPV